MVFSVALKKSVFEQTSIQSILSLYFERICRSFIRLIIPFTAWTIIGYFLNHRYETGNALNLNSLFSFLGKVLINPDWSLWFLVCIFYCIFTLCIFEFCLTTIRIRWKIKKQYFLDLALVLISIYISSIMRRVGIKTSDYGVGLLAHYFFYFTLGYILAGPAIRTLLGKPLTYLCIPAFICLAPFWHRTAPHHLISSAPESLSTYLSNDLFGSVLIVNGSFFTLLLVEFFSKHPDWILSKFLAQCGVLSLGIYAIHFYFLSYNPPVLAALIISVIMTMVIQKIPVLRVVLLGEPSRAKTVTSNTNPIERQ